MEASEIVLCSFIAIFFETFSLTPCTSASKETSAFKSESLSLSSPTFKDSIGMRVSLAAFSAFFFAKSLNNSSLSGIQSLPTRILPLRVSKSSTISRGKGSGSFASEKQLAHRLSTSSFVSFPHLTQNLFIRIHRTNISLFAAAFARGNVIEVKHRVKDVKVRVNVRREQPHDYERKPEKRRALILRENFQ